MTKPAGRYRRFGTKKPAPKVEPGGLSVERYTLREDVIHGQRVMVKVYPPTTGPTDPIRVEGHHRKQEPDINDLNANRHFAPLRPLRFGEMSHGDVKRW